jgi:hypothetical protein
MRRRAAIAQNRLTTLVCEGYVIRCWLPSSQHFESQQSAAVNLQRFKLGRKGTCPPDERSVQFGVAGLWISGCFLGVYLRPEY